MHVLPVSAVGSLEVLQLPPAVLHVKLTGNSRWSIGVKVFSGDNELYRQTQSAPPAHTRARIIS